MKQSTNPPIILDSEQPKVEADIQEDFAEKLALAAESRETGQSVKSILTSSYRGKR